MKITFETLLKLQSECEREVVAEENEHLEKLTNGVIAYPRFYRGVYEIPNGKGYVALYEKLVDRLGRMLEKGYVIDLDEGQLPTFTHRVVNEFKYKKVGEI